MTVHLKSNTNLLSLLTKFAESNARTSNAQSAGNFASLLSDLQKLPTHTNSSANVAQAKQEAPIDTRSTPLSSLLFVQASAAAETATKTASTAKSITSAGANDMTLEAKLKAFSEMEKAYNNLMKTAAKAGGAPLDYRSPYVSPGIRQGLGITDRVDGVEVKRADLYFASDMMRSLRLQLRAGESPTLPLQYQGNVEVQAKFDEFIAAYHAMPTFAGPSGMNLPGLPSRPMEGPDANALRKLLENRSLHLANAEESEQTILTLDDGLARP